MYLISSRFKDLISNFFGYSLFIFEESVNNTAEVDGCLLLIVNLNLFNLLMLGKRTIINWQG